MTLKEGADPSDATIIVEAPASLPGGYVFDVESNGNVFPVVVPEGGVSEGQTFQSELPLPQPIAPPSVDDNVVAVPVDYVIPMPVEVAQEHRSDVPISTTTRFVVNNPDGTQTTTEETVHSDGTVVRTSITQSIANTITPSDNLTLDQEIGVQPKVSYAHVPEGAWRTPLCECHNAGMCWMVLCCTFIPLGQLLQRLKLDFNGDQGDYKMTCSIWTAIWTVLLSSVGIAAALSEYALFLFFALFIYFGYALVKTRYYMRRRYSIPSCCSRCKPKNQCNGCCNDCCCVFYCAPCVLCQMLTHTHDEFRYHYTWHSRTGLPKDAPQIE